MYTQSVVKNLNAHWAGLALLLLSLLYASGCASRYAMPADDPMFAKPYIDVDEWRKAPVKHRYVHGGFKGTDTRFSYYFPEKKQYQGRFFQYITPVPDSEYLSQGATGEDDKIGFSIASGAYFIETNGGGKSQMALPGRNVDPTISAYRANAAAAQFSRIVAMKMYGKKRPYGYAFGGSGGGYRTIGGAENTDGVWDGVVPYVIGSPMAIPNMFTTRMYGLRVLQNKLPLIADAADAGGGDIYAGLNEEETAALKEVTSMGFPARAWPVYKSLGLHGFVALYPAILMADSSYFKDFWTLPGYEGFDGSPSLKRARIELRSKVKRLIMAEDAEAMGLQPPTLAGQPKNLADNAWKSVASASGGELPVAIQLEDELIRKPFGIDLFIHSGTSAGSLVQVTEVDGDLVIPGVGGHEKLAGLKVGDVVALDNVNYLAAQTYHRHQVPGPEYYTWDQFRDKDGRPLYPQRPVILGPLFAKSASGTVQSGVYKGKMIVIENLFDTEAFPWQADWYRNRVKEHLGDQTDNNFRLWYVDRATHSDSSRLKDPLLTVSYLGALQQALRDLSVWVEKGVVPPQTTSYKIVDGQVVVPASANERHGIQPVIKLTANGEVRAEVEVAEPVAIEATVEVPQGTGKLVSAEWTIEQQGVPYGKPFAALDLSSVKKIGNKTILKMSHRFDAPGTYFAVLRVASERNGNTDTDFARVQNLARARIVVAQ